MVSRQLQRHDQFFQRLLDQPGAAGALLRERLPAEVAALLVAEPPELVPGTFVSRRLRGYRTDRLYRTRTLTGRPALIYTLVEHKSRPEQRISLQLLGYQTQILEQWDAREGKAPDGTLRPLPALITLVVYNGTEDWNVPLSLAEATDADPALRPWTVDFRYSLVNLKSIPDARLSTEKVLRVGLLILKYGRPARKDRRKLIRLIRVAHALGDDDLVTLVYYLLGDPDGPHQDLIRSTLDDVLPEQGDRIMSTFVEQLRAEGFNLGVVQGEAKGEARGKADTLLRQLLRRDKTLPSGIEDRVRAAGIDQLDEWSERFADGLSLSEIFGPDQTH